MKNQDDLYDIYRSDVPDDDHGLLRGGPAGPVRFRSFGWRVYLIIVAALFLLIVWPSWAGFYTDWLWFGEVGYRNVFSTVLTTKLVSGFAGGLFGALLFFGNVLLALKLSGKAGTAGYKINLGAQQIAIADAGKLIARMSLPLSIVAGVFVGARSWNAWDIWLPFRYGEAFGEVDPVLGLDIGFYFFRLPWLDFVSGMAIALTGFLFVSAALIYVSRAALAFSANRRIAVKDGARVHLLVLLALFFGLLAFRDYLDLPAMLLGGEGTVTGAGYSAVHATMPLIWAKISVAVLVSLIALAGIFIKNIRLVLVGVAFYFVAVVAGAIYPALVQRFSVAPNELVRESPYIVNSIAATQKAYAIDRVEEKELTGETVLTAQDIQENRQTINSIRLWDQGPLLSTFAQLQEIRPYYEFQSVDNDRYLIDGELQQVMLSLRELESEKLPNRNWINERFIFTHGYGLTLGSVNRVTREGLPLLFIKDIPPVSTVPSLAIDRPEVYYGEMPDGPAYVKTRQQEFNYPEGEKNQFSTYEGTGGVSLGSYYRKLLFATRFGDLKLMLSNDITPESRVLFNRNIRERLQAIAPFVVFDRDPYPVITDGKCIWLCDGYTTSDRYPYSRSVSLGTGDRLNYIRNSVKATVDTYNGSVNLYIADDKDPLIRTYAKIFPNLLQPLSEMPEKLRAHLRYPEDIFRIQTQMYATYHMDQPQVFYNKEDQWEIASAVEQDGASIPMDPYYTVMKLPSEAREEFLAMLPFVPKNKLNLAAWMVARCDGESYGKLLVYRLPKQKQVFGPKQIVGRINQDAEIAQQLTLWNQRGSRVNFGTMLLIPIKESILYVQPLYLQAETGKIPELKRVVVVNENRIAMGETLDESLKKLFGAVAPPSSPRAAESAPGAQAAPSDVQSSIAAQALEHDELANRALRDGDWARYGEERKKVRALLEQLAKTR